MISVDAQISSPNLQSSICTHVHRTAYWLRSIFQLKGSLHKLQCILLKSSNSSRKISFVRKRRKTYCFPGREAIYLKYWIPDTTQHASTGFSELKGHCLRTLFFFQIRYVYCISIWFPSSFQWASSSNHISTPAVLWITFDSLNKLHFSLYIFFFFFKIKSILSNTKRIKQNQKRRI